MKENISIYQQGERTTIVVYGLTEATKDRLLKVLFGGLKAEADVEEVQDLIPEAPLDDMTEFDTQAMEKIGGVEIEAEKMINALEAAYQNDPIRLAVEYTKAKNLDGEIGAIAYQKGLSALFSRMADQDLQQMRVIMYHLRTLDVFAGMIRQLAPQKGCGDLSAIDTLSEEFNKASIAVLQTLNEEEFRMIYKKAAETVASDSAN